MRAFVGHGIGEQFHTDLQIPHYYEPRLTTVMEPGMIFTIEPMISMGTGLHRIWDDDWTAVTADGSRTAQFEHTVLVTDDGVEILTLTGGRLNRCATPGSPWPRSTSTTSSSRSCRPT